MGLLMVQESELIPTERVAIVVWRLRDGESLSTAEVALAVGLTNSGAWRLLQKLSRVLPVYQTDSGLWEMVQNESDKTQ